MSHEITELDCQVGLTPAWHNLTIVVDQINRENSGICYEMEERPLVYQNGIDEAGSPIYVPSGSKQIVSLDNGLPIGPAVNESYTMISNNEVFDLIEKSLDGTKHTIDSTGSVKARSIVFVSVKLDEGFKAAGRLTESRLNFLWGHSGKMALITKTGLTQVVCANTVMMALCEHSDFKLSVKHTKNAKAEIVNLEKAIAAHIKVCDGFQELMDKFANISITPNQAEKMFAGFLAKSDGKELLPLSTRTRNTIDRLYQLFKGGAGNNGDDMADVVSAITDFYTHESSGGGNRWKQFESSEFGAGNTAKINFIEAVKTEEDRKALIKRGDSVLCIPTVE